MPENNPPKPRTAKGEGDTVSVTIQLHRVIYGELQEAADVADRTLPKMLARALKDDATRKAVIDAGK